MTSLLSLRSPLDAPVPGTAQRSGTTADEVTDEWPRTTRVAPWLVAAFVALLYIVPFDAMLLPIPLPVDPKPDRFVIGAAVCIVVAGWLLGRPSPQRRLTLTHVTVTVYLLVGVTSIFVNLDMLVVQNELRLVIRGLASMLGYVGAFWLIIRVVRPGREVHRLTGLAIALGCVTALGTIVEYRLAYNAFYTIAEALPAVTVRVPYADPASARPMITGPTAHGLSVTTLLGMTFALALVRGLTREGLARLAYMGACVLLFAGMVSTFRKTSLVVPLVVIGVIVAYRPRTLRVLLPATLAVVLSMAVIIPGALSDVADQLRAPFDSASSSARIADYQAVIPDIAAHPILGRGIGGFSPLKYRTLDNQVLGVLVDTGILGVLTWVALIVSVFILASRVIRMAPDREDRDFALGTIAAVLGFAASHMLYDVLAFPQTAYLFFVLAGLITVTWSGVESASR